MAAKIKRSARIETVWLRQWARSYQPSEAGFWFPNDPCLDCPTLIDIRHAFKVGTVLSSERLSSTTARWKVLGEDSDGNLLMISIIVIVEELLVSLEHVERIQEAAKQEEGSHVA